MRGLVAQFDTLNAAVRAIEQLRQFRLSRIEAYSPRPSKELDRALAAPASRLPRIVLIGGLVGAASAYLLQWWVKVVAYPQNVGGRPDHAPLAFLPLAFESGVLLAGLAGFIGFLVLSGLPRLHHPLFEQLEFLRASCDAYFVSVDADDPAFDEALCRKALNEHGAGSIQSFGESRREEDAT